MNAAEKFAQDSLIAQMAATLLAGEYAGGAGLLPRGSMTGTIERRRINAAAAVAQARAVWDAATDARIKGDTQ
jgi:hypothetical protein